MELTNVLLTVIATLLGIIGYFMTRFYDHMQLLFRDFHKAMEVQATHEARLSHIERHIENQ